MSTEASNVTVYDTLGWQLQPGDRLQLPMDGNTTVMGVRPHDTSLQDIYVDLVHVTA